MNARSIILETKPTTKHGSAEFTLLVSRIKLIFINFSFSMEKSNKRSSKTNNLFRYLCSQYTTFYNKSKIPNAGVTVIVRLRKKYLPFVMWHFNNNAEKKKMECRSREMSLYCHRKGKREVQREIYHISNHSCK